MNCASTSRPIGRPYDFASEPRPGPSWREDPHSQFRHRQMASAAAVGSQNGFGPSRGSFARPDTASGDSPGAAAAGALSITSLAVERHPPEITTDRSLQPLASGLTRVQASKSSAKIILDDHQTGYLAVVPPDIERDLMKYTAPARDGTIGPRPIKPSMLFEFDYRPKISTLLPHESHKEVSAHLNIAWKSIGQDILQLYKDLAKKVEQKLRFLNGETEVRAVQKRKAAAARRNSRDPPPNSGLRRCNCRSDCPKYKIIPGSDLEKKWITRGERPKTIRLESGDDASDVGSGADVASAAAAAAPPAPTHNVTPQSAQSAATAGHFLFGGPRTPNAVGTPLSHRGIPRPEAVELPDLSPLPSGVLHQSPREAVQMPRPSSAKLPDALIGDNVSEVLYHREPPLAAPMDIAQAAAVAADVDQTAQFYHQNGDASTIYYSMPPQLDPQQQGFVYDPMQQRAATFPPFVDPTDLQQMDLFQGSFIYPNGTIVNANGEPIAVTLPPIQFANIVPQSEAAGVAAGEDVAGVAEAANVASESAPDTHARDVPADAPPPSSDIVATAFENDDTALTASEGRFSMIDGDSSTLTKVGELEASAAVEGQTRMGVVEGAVTEIQVGIDRDEFASEVTSVVPSDASEGIAFTNAGEATVAETPESPVVRATRDGHPEGDGRSGRGETGEGKETASTFTWHQVQAAEGRVEVPAQEIGWAWNKNITTSNTSLLSGVSDKKDEKEKLFALQANLNGVETDSKEFEEVKMDQATGKIQPPPPPLDPRQSLDEVEKKADFEGGKEEEDEDDGENQGEGGK